MGPARLTTEQAQHYREQIADRRRLDEIITAMQDISAHARDCSSHPSPRPTHPGEAANRADHRPSQ